MTAEGPRLEDRALSIESFEQDLLRRHDNSEVAEDLIRQLRFHKENIGNALLIFRKDKNLVVIIDELIKKKLYPIIDTKLGLAFFVPSGTHQWVLAALYYFHKGECEDDSVISDDLAADLFIMEGMGYFMSSTSQMMMIVSPGYAADRYDQGVFGAYEQSNNF